MLRSPIRWAGGKSRLRKQIIALFAPHSCYVELFAGAAWVLFGKPPSPVEVLNDIDGDLVNFFRVIQTQPEAFLQSFELTLVAREIFEDLAAQDAASLDPIARAHRFYYLIMAGWGGELNYPRFQTSIQDGGHGNRLIGAMKTLRERILPIYDRLHTVIIEHLDWAECFARYDREGVLMYVDPPYPGNGVNYAHNMRDWHAHEQLAQKLKASRAKWILSSYDTAQVRQLYAGYPMIATEVASGLQVSAEQSERVIVDELLILNYEPPLSADSAPPNKAQSRLF